MQLHPHAEYLPRSYEIKSTKLQLILKHIAKQLIFLLIDHSEPCSCHVGINLVLYSFCIFWCFPGLMCLQLVPVSSLLLASINGVLISTKPQIIGVQKSYSYHIQFSPRTIQTCCCPSVWIIHDFQICFLSNIQNISFHYWWHLMYYLLHWNLKFISLFIFHFKDMCTHSMPIKYITS